MSDFETDETTEYLFDDAPTTVWHPLDGAAAEWSPRTDDNTRAESPKARRQ